MTPSWGGTLFDTPRACAHGRQPDERCPWCEIPSTAQTRHESQAAIKPSKARLQKIVLECITRNPHGITDEPNLRTSRGCPATRPDRVMALS